MKKNEKNLPNNTNTHPDPTLIIAGGRVIDPATRTDGIMDVSIAGDKIIGVGPDQFRSSQTKVINANGCLVTPGLIDLHTHVYRGFGGWTFGAAIDPDEVGVRSAVTTVVDCSTFPNTFTGLRQDEISNATTRILSFMKLSDTWWDTFLRLDLWRGSDTELQRLLEPEKVGRFAMDNRDIIKGIKVLAIGPASGSAGIKALAMGKEAANVAGVPLVSHISNPVFKQTESGLKTLTGEVLDLLEGGDVLIHCFTGLEGGLVQPDGSVLPQLEPALKRGVLLDVAHGAYMFSFDSAKRLLEDGIVPNTISTDIHMDNRKTMVFDLPTTLSKFLALGLGLGEAIATATINPAKALGMENVIGSLRPGMDADVSILKEVKGKWLFVDSLGKTVRSDTTLTPFGAVRMGKYIESDPSTFLLSVDASENGPVPIWKLRSPRTGRN
jgi:dihydroorotase